MDYQIKNQEKPMKIKNDGTVYQFCRTDNNKHFGTLTDVDNPYSTQQHNCIPKKEAWMGLYHGCHFCAEFRYMRNFFRCADFAE